MGHERSDRVWDAYRESTEKLDYFMLALAGALTGYLGKDLSLAPLGLNASTLALGAVVSFALSMYAGFKRVEWQVAAVAGNHTRLHHGEAAGNLASIAQESDSIINLGTGDVLSKDEAFVSAQAHKHKSDAVLPSIATAIAKSATAYTWRNRLLYLGLALLVAGRIVKAYGF